MQDHRPAKNKIVLVVGNYSVKIEDETEGYGSPLGMVFPDATQYVDEDEERDIAEAHCPLPRTISGLRLAFTLRGLQIRTSTVLTRKVIYWLAIVRHTGMVRKTFS